MTPINGWNTLTYISNKICSFNIDPNSPCSSPKDSCDRKKKGQQMNHKLPHYPIRGKHPVETEPTKPLTAKWFWHVSIGNWAAQWTTHPASIDDMRWHKNTLLQVLLDSSPIKSGDVSIAMVSSSSFIVHPYSSHLPSMQRQLCHLQPAPGCKLWWPPFTLSCPIRNLTKLGR
jgi:hypothetical protein